MSDVNKDQLEVALAKAKKLVPEARIESYVRLYM